MCHLFAIPILAKPRRDPQPLQPRTNLPLCRSAYSFHLFYNNTMFFGMVKWHRARATSLAVGVGEAKGFCSLCSRRCL
jgi:hypothetical protein